MSRIHRLPLFTCVAITTAVLTGQLTSAQPNSQPNPYRTIESYFTLPDGRKLGGTAGIETDRDGRSIWAFERCGGDTCEGSNVAPLLKFDASGKLVNAFGTGMFVVPHGLHVDRDGNVWVTDGQGAHGKGQQVFKFSPQGKVLMTLGKPGVAGESPDTFNRPSDVFVAPNGDVFVADGHGGETNARIVKFSKNGTFIKAWGKKGSGRGEFDTPHTLAMDSRGRLFVGDRGNNRIQIFDQEGTFLDEWKQFGRPSGIYIDKNDILYSTDHQSTEQTNPGWKKGIRIGSAKDGRVTAFILDPDANPSQEGVTADAAGNVFSSLTGGRAIKKYSPLASPAQQQGARASEDWPLHNLDLAGSRFSTLDQINTSNVRTLTPRWLFQHGVIDGVSNQTTPVIVDGVMYVTDSRGSVYAVDAADGHLRWTYDVTALLGGGRAEGYVFRNRGVCYADGVVYVAGGSFLFALDAKTGKPIQGFGKDGQASVILDVLKTRYPEAKTAISMGYWFTTAPQVYNGVLYIGSTRSESHIPGGHVFAVDAKTGKVLWHFNTVPQDEKDQGWEIAGPTWVGGERNGGGIWETPAIDPELGMLYVAVGNPFGDSRKRAGKNLFTDSIIALALNTGKLAWYYQQTHHDIWDYDSGGPPILFDMQVQGRRVKAVAEASKNGYLYILNRETGEPVHPIKEMPVPTETSLVGEQPWPTQPIPHTAAGKPMRPVSPTFPTEIPPERLAKFKPVPAFTPPSPNYIIAPGMGGGANYGSLSYSPRTGLLYVNAIDDPLNGGRPPKGYFSAFDPTTGELKWQHIYEGYGQAGSVVTAGGLVFVGSGSNVAGYFFAFDAKSGQLLWKFNTGAGVFGSPSVYMVNGEEFVAVASGGGERGRRGGDLILSFALPRQK